MKFDIKKIVEYAAGGDFAIECGYTDVLVRHRFEEFVRYLGGKDEYKKYNITYSAKYMIFKFGEREIYFVPYCMMLPDRIYTIVEISDVIVEE